jgi:hypothetical protein
MSRAHVITIATVAVLAVLAFLGHRAHLGKLSPPMILLLRISLGVIFFILGIVGSLLPVLQGWIFFLLAFLVLFPNHHLAVKALDKIEPKMPRMVSWLRRAGIGRHRPGDDTMRAQ